MDFSKKPKSPDGSPPRLRPKSPKSPDLSLPRFKPKSPFI